MKKILNELNTISSLIFITKQARVPLHYIQAKWIALCIIYLSTTQMKE